MKNFALVCLNDANYQPLADITWYQNKLRYATMHNYWTHYVNTNIQTDVNIGFEKIRVLNEYMRSSPWIEWVWWTGTDSLITNFTIKIEDRIDNAYNIVIANDVNGLNTDSMLFKNVPETHDYLFWVFDQEPRFRNNAWQEQGVIWESLGIEKYNSMIKQVPQRDMNSYQYNLYGLSPYDKLGNPGDWRPGDWLIHWAGTKLEQRLQLADHYMKLVQYV